MKQCKQIITLNLVSTYLACFLAWKEIFWKIVSTLCWLISLFNIVVSTHLACFLVWKEIILKIAITLYWLISLFNIIVSTYSACFLAWKEIVLKIVNTLCWLISLFNIIHSGHVLLLRHSRNLCCIKIIFRDFISALAT